MGIMTTAQPDAQLNGPATPDQDAYIAQLVAQLKAVNANQPQKAPDLSSFRTPLGSAGTMANQFAGVYNKAQTQNAKQGVFGAPVGQAKPWVNPDTVKPWANPDDVPYAG